MGHCYAEPLVMISRPGFPSLCYGKVDEGLVERLVKDYLLDDDPCYEYALAAVDPNDIFPTFNDFPPGDYRTQIILKQCGFIAPPMI